MNTARNVQSVPPNPRTLRSVGRKVAPILASALARPPWLNYLRWCETYLALLQGKGAGDGWDLKAKMNNIDSRTFFRDYWDLLNPLGFSIFRIAPGGILIQIREYREELEYFKIVSNYVAVSHAKPIKPTEKE